MTQGIVIPPDSMNAIVQKAIMETITPEQRDSILTEAVAQLLTNEKVEFGRAQTGTNPLQLAFNEAVRVGTVKYVRQLVDQDQAIQKRIEEVVGDFLLKALGAEGAWELDGLNSKITDAFAGALIDWAKERRR